MRPRVRPGSSQPTNREKDKGPAAPPPQPIVPAIPSGPAIGAAISPVRIRPCPTAREFRFPAWLAVITRLNPLTYAVDPLRHLIFDQQHMPAAAAERFATGVTLFGYTLPTAMELAITCVFAVVFLTLAVSGFGKPE